MLPGSLISPGRQMDKIIFDSRQGILYGVFRIDNQMTLLRQIIKGGKISLLFAGNGPGRV
jgi:hypothetical protein